MVAQADMRELLRTPYVQFRGDLHQIVPAFGTVSGWLQREFPRRDLFVYRHLKLGTFTIAEWVCRGTRLFRPVMVLEGPGSFDRRKAARLVGRLRQQRQAVAQARRDVVGREHDDWRAEADEAGVREDTYKTLLRNTHSAVKKDHPLLRAYAGMDRP